MEGDGAGREKGRAAAELALETRERIEEEEMRATDLTKVDAIGGGGEEGKRTMLGLGFGRGREGGRKRNGGGV